MIHVFEHRTTNIRITINTETWLTQITQGSHIQTRPTKHLELLNLRENPWFKEIKSCSTAS